MLSVYHTPTGCAANDLTLKSVDIPVVAEDEVLVRIAASAVNRADILQRNGKYPPPAGASTILGLECSGVVKKIGAAGDESGLNVGDRVMTLLSGGGYAEYAAVKKRHVMRVPSSFDLVSAAAIPEAWLTAFQILTFVAQVKPNDWVLVHAGASGVGTAAIQLITRVYGAKAIATVGNQDKAGFVRNLGASPILYKEEDIASRVIEITDGTFHIIMDCVDVIMNCVGGHGADIIMDCIGGSYVSLNAKSLAMDGMWVLYGLMGGLDGPTDVLLPTILRKRAAVRGTTLRGRTDQYKAELIERFSKATFDHFESGTLKPVVDSIFSLDSIWCRDLRQCLFCFVLFAVAAQPLPLQKHCSRKITYQRKLNERSVDQQREIFKTCTEVMTLIQDVQIPVIAEVRGLAAASGCQPVAVTMLQDVQIPVIAEVRGLAAAAGCQPVAVTMLQDVQIPVIGEVRGLAAAAGCQPVAVTMLQDVQIPVIAEVRGLAAAAGCQPVAVTILQDVQIPVIAEVRGLAAAAGCQPVAVTMLQDVQIPVIAEVRGLAATAGCQPVAVTMLQDVQIPVIAEVRGLAAAAGCQPVAVTMLQDVQIPVIAEVRGLAAASGCQPVAVTMLQDVQIPVIAEVRGLAAAAGCQPVAVTMLQDVQIPVIAEVRGLAAAAGCQLVATCDIAVAAENSSFSTPGIKFGLFCSTPGVALSRAVPRKVALDMLLTGDAIGAQEALRAGLVSRIVPEDEVQKEALSIAETICGYSKSVVGMGKSFFYAQVQADRATAYRHGEAVMLQNLELVDCQEGLNAFVEKRKPAWTHGLDVAQIPQKS